MELAVKWDRPKAYFRPKYIITITCERQELL